MTCWPVEWIEAAIRTDLAERTEGGMRLRVMDADTLRDRLGDFAFEIANAGDDAERWRWFRDDCSLDRKLEIVKLSGHDRDMLDHHIDKGRCGL